MKMKKYISKNMVVIVVVSFLTSITTMGCSSYKAIPDLNIYYPNVYAAYGSPAYQIRGIFCSNQEFYNKYILAPSLKPRLSIVLNDGYTRYITGSIHAYDKEKKDVYNSLKLEILNHHPVYQECQTSSKYPHIYWFTMDLEENYPDSNIKKERMSEYYSVINQIKEKKYLDVRAILVPMASTNIEGSAQDARMYFTNEQVTELFRKKE